MSKYYEVFAPYLTRIKKGSQGNYIARCPFHEDKNPSFSFNAETGLWQCFAGCGAGTVRQFLERVGVRDIDALLGESTRKRPIASSKWARRSDPVGPKRPSPSKPSPKKPNSNLSSPKEPNLGSLSPQPPQDYILQRTYDYTDIEGDTLYLKDRFVRKNDPTDKTFRIRWVSDRKQTVFYGLSHLHEGIERILFVEGEKCAEAVSSVLAESDEITAVLSYNSPSKEFEASQCLDYIAGRRIYIFGDNDEPGRQKAEDLVNVLKAHVPAIHLWTFPDKPEKYDIADYLDEGGDLDHLLQSAPKVYENPLLELVLPDIPYYQVDEIQYTQNFHIPIGVVGLLAGTGGVGKSYVSLYMMLTLAAEECIPCLYISLEDSKQILLLRLKSLLHRYPVVPQDMPSTKIGVIDHVEPTDFMLILEDAIVRKGYRFIFVDPIGALFDDENNNTEIQAFMRHINGLCARYAANVILVHHLRKFALQSDDRETLYSAVRGASAFVNNARLVWVARKLKVNGQMVPNVLEMVCVKSNYGKLLDYRVDELFPGEDDGVFRYVRFREVDPFTGGTHEDSTEPELLVTSSQPTESTWTGPSSLDDLFTRRNDPIWQEVKTQLRAQIAAQEAEKAAEREQGIVRPKSKRRTKAEA